MSQYVDDTMGRRLEINMDFQEKRIFVNLHKVRQAVSTPAVFTPKQALKMAAILTNAVRHTLGWVDDGEE